MIAPFMIPVHALPAPEWLGDGGSVTESFLRHIVERSKETMLEDGQLPPVTHVLGFDLKQPDQFMIYVVMLGPFMETEEHKELLASIMPGLLQRMRAFCVVTVTEAWTLHSETETLEDLQNERDKYGGLANHPNAVEVVTVVAEAGQWREMHNFAILRDGDGKVTGLGDDLSAGRDFQAEGRFCNWLSVPEDLH